MRWLRNLSFRRSTHDDLAEEIREHIAERTEALIARGRSPEEAAKEARRAFGNITLAHERSIEVWQWRWLENLWADLRYAVRQLAKSPGYAITAVLTLAIGIGANAAIFTLIDDVMLRSLPVAHPEQLVEVGLRSPTKQQFISGLSINTLNNLRQNTRSLADLCGWSGSMLFVPDDQGTLRSVPASLVTDNGLSMLGIHPYLGRLLVPADDVAGGPEGGWPLVLDYGFWRANYHGDPKILGKHITISSQPATIVGVMPRDFRGLYLGHATKIYLPMHFKVVLLGEKDNPYIHPDQPSMFTFGRMRPGVSLTKLNIELAAASPSFKQHFLSPAGQASSKMRTATLAAQSTSRGFAGWMDEYRRPLLLLQVIVLVVLLLCCVNLGGLQLARVHKRQYEFAVRSALGAGRGRLLQQCLTESLLLAVLGSLLAAGIAWSSTAALGAFLTPAGSDEATSLRPDARVLILTTALALVTTLLFGLLPAWIAGRTAQGTLLKSHGVHRRGNTLRRQLFIPAQFALALILVLAAGLFSQTLLRLRNNHAGFEASHIMEVTAQFQALKKTPAEIAALYRSMIDDLRVAPGVQAAAYTWVTPLTGFAPEATVHSPSQSHDERAIAFNEVGDGYFTTLGTHLLAGREFAAGDHDRSTCIANQSAVRALFPNGDALGSNIKATYEHAEMIHVDDACRIVGVVEDARYANLRDPAPPTLYFPAGAGTVSEGGYTSNLVFMIRAQTDAAAIAAYRATLARFAPNTGVMTFLPLRDQVDQSLGSERLIATLSITFAAIALLLSGIGIFGLLALRVQERTSEIGIRIAVGATRGNILRMVFVEALRVVTIGSLGGIVLSAIGLTFIKRFLYGTSPADLTIAASSLAVLTLVAFIAAAIPARRAAMLDPMKALRAD